jgi:hypothetical protein
MPRRCPPAAFGLCLAVAALAGGAGRAQEPVLVVTARSGDDLLAAFRHLAPLLGQEKRLKRVDDFLKAIPGGQGLGGASRMHRPLGLYCLWSATGNHPGPPVFVLPVADEKAVVALLRKRLLAPVAVGEGVYRVAPPQPLVPLYFRFSEGHLYLTPEAGLLRGKLPAPATALVLPPGDALLSATLHVPRVPQKARGAFQRDFEQWAVDLLGKHRIRLAEREYLATAFKSLLQENQALTLAVRLDPKRHLLGAELTLWPVPGSSLAGAAKEVGRRTSLFQDLGGPGAAGRAYASLPFPKVFSRGAVEDLRLEVEQAVSPRKKASLRRALRALGPTLGGEELDFGFAWTPARPEDTFGEFIAGLKVREPRRVEHVARDVFKDTSRLERAFGAAWNHSRHGDVRVHSFDPLVLTGLDIGLDVKRAYLAVHKDAMLVSTDRKLLAGTLDGRGQALPARESAAEVAMNLGFALPWGTGMAFGLALTGHGEFLRPRFDLEERLPKGWRTQPGLRLRCDGGRALRLRLELNTRLLDLLHWPDA